MTLTPHRSTAPTPLAPHRPSVAGGAWVSKLASAIALAIPLALGTLTPAPATLETSPKAVLDEVWQIVYREYVDGTFNQVDWLAVRDRLLSRDYSSREAAYSALREELRALNDPYTRFLDPQQYSELTEQTAGEASGVGLLVRRENGQILVTEVVPESPAAIAGFQPGDWLQMVDGQSTDRLTATGAARLLRGATNSQVTLTYSRANGPVRTVVLTRARIELPTVNYALRQVGDYRIGYIRLVEFNSHAPEQMAAAIRSLTQQGVDGFVLDLRDNPGGLLSASIEISRQWLNQGPIVVTQTREGAAERVMANRTALTTAPLALLVNQRSASSSEILAGALRDNNRALVVGTTTFGKAVVQSLYGLSDGAGLVVTVAHYYTPNGTDLSSRGITPDVEVLLTGPDQQALTANPTLWGTPGADPQFRRAVTELEGTLIAHRNGQGANPQLGRSPQPTP